MAQKKKRFTKKRKSTQRGKAAESDSDGGEFEVATGVSEMAALESKQILPSFPTTECMSDVEPDTRELVRAQNKKKKKSGGFQSMGLSYPVYKGVIKKGYKVPTPIQRKTIPLILDGKDVVAMARTGSGKTAAFLIPMFQRLQAPSAQTGARAVILSPTRELALQTLKFTKESNNAIFYLFQLGKFTGLKTAIILGGDRIIATPGRLMHVAAEMNLKLNNVEYVVFDEADRLFEMGFASQLQEIIRRLPENRQTVLFSATLPKQLVEFASAGLIDPVLVRLDVDTKLSEQLKLAFFYLRTDDKPAFLLHMLRNVVKPQEQTVVFVATRHHVEYLKELLAYNGIDCAYIYSALDQTARKINIGKFTHRKAMVMIVTDVAARGIDIPMLDNVINYNFPCKAKLFLHRVGRVARAGRCGTAYSLISADELAFVFDLNLFLGRPMRFAGAHGTDKDEDGVLGRVPQCILDDEEATVERAHENCLDLHNLKRVSENAYKQYLKSRPNPSPESIKRAKETDYSALDIHPLLDQHKMSVAARCGCCWPLFAVSSSSGCRNVRWAGRLAVFMWQTIFEINSTSKTNANEVMRAKRLRDKKLVDSFQRRHEEKVEEKLRVQTLPTSMTWEDDQEEIENVFSEVVGGKRKKPQNEKNVPMKKTKISNSDKEFYIPYRPKDFDSERGLSMKGDGSSFERQASSAMLDLLGDEEKNMNQHKSMMKWDRKRKRFVRETGKEDKKKLKTESGQLIKRSYKKNMYLFNVV
ncbi:DDX54 helicase, partial [Polypterus senegalus]